MKTFQEQSSRTIRTGILLLLTMVVGGTLGFRLIENIEWIDSFYMTVITISTVGFREVKPLSDAGKLFTTTLIFFSLGSIAYVGYLARFIFDGDFINYYKSYRVEKRIQRLYNHVIICGYGRNGEQAGKELLSHNTPFVVIDNREEVISKINSHPADIMYIYGDATKEEILKKAGIQRAKALITATSHDSENVFVVLTARSLNPKLKIISRAIDPHSEEKLKKAGADNVIMPELIGGQRMAKLVTQPDIVEFLENMILQKPTEVSLEEVSCINIADGFIGKPILHLKRRDISGSNIIGVRDRNGKFIFNPGSEYIMESEDLMFVLGTREQIRIFRKVLEETNDEF